MDFILTTAFTDKPVSMKYRGVYELMKRGEGFLQYTTQAGTITTKEAIEDMAKEIQITLDELNARLTGAATLQALHGEGVGDGFSGEERPVHDEGAV